MIILIYLTGFALTVAASLFLTPIVRQVAHRNLWIDVPDGDRKIHKTPIPIVGGLAIIAAFFVGLAYFAMVKRFFPDTLGTAIQLPTPYMLVCAIGIGLVGLYDDLRGMHFATKFALQIAIGAFFVLTVDSILEIGNPFTGGVIILPGWLSAILTILWIVVVINAINLLDGMDGLASGVSVIIFGSLTAAYAVMGHWGGLTVAVIMVGSALGFLRYNFNPACIFMGDTGSLFLGFMLATFALNGASNANSLLALLIPIIALGLPVVDTGLAILRRFFERRPLFHPDRDHIHHRISKRFQLSHRTTVLILYVVSSVFGILAFMLAISQNRLVDNLWSTIILCLTGICIFFLLRFLGYLPDLKKLNQDLSEHSSLADPSSSDLNGTKQPELHTEVEQEKPVLLRANGKDH